MTNRTIFLTAAFLALWLPTQALATVLVHCMSMESHSGSSASGLMHSSAMDDTIEDCHGQAAAADSGSTYEATPNTSGHHDVATDCVHCSGGCHKLQTVLAPERDGERFPLDSDDRATRTRDLATGYPDFPIRPPIVVLSA